MSASLEQRTVLVIGRGSGIARAITLAAREAGAKVVVAGRDAAALAAAYQDPGITAETVDLIDEASVEALAARLGSMDHVVSPGTIDTGAYDALGTEKKAALFDQRAQTNPVCRIGTVQDVAEAVLFALTNTFLTGVSIPVDGGEPLVSSSRP